MAPFRGWNKIATCTITSLRDCRVNHNFHPETHKDKDKEKDKDKDKDLSLDE